MKGSPGDESDSEVFQVCGQQGEGSKMMQHSFLFPISSQFLLLLPFDTFLSRFSICIYFVSASLCPSKAIRLKVVCEQVTGQHLMHPFVSRERESELEGSKLVRDKMIPNWLKCSSAIKVVVLAG